MLDDDAERTTGALQICMHMVLDIILELLGWIWNYLMVAHMDFVEEGQPVTGLREAEITTRTPQNFKYMIVEVPPKLLRWI